MSDTTIETMTKAGTKTGTDENEPRPLARMLGFTRWTIYVMLASGALALLGGMAGYTVGPEYLMDDYSYPETAPGEVVLLTFGLGLVGFYVAFFVSAVAVCRFVFRAMRNLHLVDAPSAEMAPGWVVGWYFVPLANLFKPMEGMRQILDGSYEAAGREADAAPSLALWWGTWLTGSIIGNVAETLTDPGAALGADLLSILLLMISAWALLGHMRRITETQQGMIAARVF